VGLVLDTSAVVAMERAGVELPDALRRLGTDDLALPAIVLAELLVGMRLGTGKRRIEARRAKIDELREATRVVDFTAEIAERWANLFAILERGGNRIPANDLTVAATAAHLEFSLLVSPQDEAHFRRVRGLNVVTWQPE